jgi:hypothetical protein
MMLRSNLNCLELYIKGFEVQGELHLSGDVSLYCR